jgi:hypothetical protein
MILPVASLDIVIVNWNTGDLLASCVQSVFEADASSATLDRVVVVDNASSDRSLSRLGRFGDRLTVIRNTENRGFAAACNQGARIGTSEYVLFLNPDTRLFRDSLQRPLRFMNDPAHVDVGICGVRLVDQHGQHGAAAVSCSRFPTPTIFLSQMLGLHRLAPRLVKSHILTPAECAVSREVDQIIGAFFLVRRRIFDELKGFDERVPGGRLHLSSGRGVDRAGARCTPVLFAAQSVSLRVQALYANAGCGRRSWNIDPGVCIQARGSLRALFGSGGARDNRGLLASGVLVVHQPHNGRIPMTAGAAFRERRGRLAALSQMRPVVLELGCGSRRRHAAAIMVDALDHEVVDVGDGVAVLAAIIRPTIGSSSDGRRGT